MDNKKQKKEEIIEEIELDNELKEEELEVNEEAQKDKKIEELSDQLKRAVADYRNLERRSYEERADALKFANKKLIESLLPAFDTLFLAGRYTTDDSVKLTIGRILDILKENGIEKVNTLDTAYNADTMEAVEVVPGEDGRVLEELRPGFVIFGKLIRPAQVRVGKTE